MRPFNSLIQDLKRTFAIAPVSEFRPAGFCTLGFDISVLPGAISSIDLAAALDDVQLLKLA